MSVCIPPFSRYSVALGRVTTEVALSHPYLSLTMIHKSNFSYREILEARTRHTAGKPWTQGLHIVQMAAPDLVLTDLLMPETDGLEVTTALHRGFPATRMTALSEGMADMNFLHVAVERGPIAH